MKNLKTLVLFFVILLVFSHPTLGESNGIHGEISVKYDPIDSCSSIYIDLHYNFYKWLTIGANEVSNIQNYGTIGVFPSFVPYSQGYNIYIKFNFNQQLSLQISQWTVHPSYERYSIYGPVPQGIYLEGKYTF